MTTENQNVVTLKKAPLKTNRIQDKKTAFKSLSLKPNRSMKRSLGLKSNPLKLK